ncbi:MAG: hypothetical protein COW00_01055 [Bdellovibrio sp. CG12_big_fil_rev_8_21_14_0_65_39_13]|nr:MAG: hypothetical protein COW78_10350 [Bdellovibrio sp. CG22_combo_CG10-13_8_21_14_all_39_27]PIQ62741.1 MAG: hypothetical protein COW00_01055 [Bdellovibrio sp. CG12_big_fil_rev_8_21_14_0_65_39_13]PIR36063.1 MAG: hypothetical protein COV37_05275 [Bdellovibrio sp. CG11_big_fil_rev_8_21_14_0_20_39_38]PJB52311.1 MAG: hypothetical protein CO099_13305 [Bdellovibrio sp. CG_4_9_14_3_um_filter_39_7]
MKTKTYWAIGLTALSLLSCAPKDQLVENPFYTSPTAENLEFEQLFAENNQALSGDIALFTSDRLAEAARMLEFALNADTEVEAYKKELAVLESGGRARSYVLCRKLKSFSRLQGSKTYAISWDGCKDSRSGKKTETEVRGPEDYNLEFSMPGITLPSLIEAETGDGLTLKLSELDDTGKRVRGSRGDLNESRSMRSQLIDVDQKIYEFTYRSVTSHEVIRSKGRNKGTQDNGEISSVIEGKFQLKEIPGGRLVVDKYIQAKNDSLSTTVKATRKDVAGKVKDKFYIMINDLILDNGETQVNVPGGTTSIMVPTGTNPDGSVILESQKMKFCGQFRSQFTSKTMWLTGSPRNRSNRLQETLNFGEDDIVLQSESGNRSLGRCLKRTDIAPLVNRDRFYF